MKDLLLATTGVAIVALVLILEFVRYSRSRKFMQKQMAVMGRMQKDMHALCAGAINMGKHVDSLEGRIRRLGERQDRLQLRDPMEQAYTRAIRLAQKGVDVNELVENCGLSRGEAELLLRIHRVQERHATAV
ncbi:MAG: DUF2802 domain-containing protein [Gammaproteobacteria bacterium]|jgi:hypothetical protein